MDTPALDFGKKLVELAMAYKGVSSNERDVERFVLVDHRENVPHEFVAPVVGQLAQLDVAAEVSDVEGVAAWAAERALLGNFYGKRRRTGRQG